MKVAGAGGQWQRKSNKDQQKSNKDHLWCTYCKKQRHTKETCSKLHGKGQVLSHLGGFKGLLREPANLARQEYTKVRLGQRTTTNSIGVDRETKGTT